jgi:hypothetical protein
MAIFRGGLAPFRVVGERGCARVRLLWMIEWRRSRTLAWMNRPKTTGAYHTCCRVFFEVLGKTWHGRAGARSSHIQPCDYRVRSVLGLSHSFLFQLDNTHAYRAICLVTGNQIHIQHPRDVQDWGPSVVPQREPPQRLLKPLNSHLRSGILCTAGFRQVEGFSSSFLEGFRGPSPLAPFNRRLSSLPRPTRAHTTSRRLPVLECAHT